MTWILALILTLVGGWFLARRLCPVHRSGVAALGVLFGMGAVSILFFLLLVCNLAQAPVVWAMLVAFAVGSAAIGWRSPVVQGATRPGLFSVTGMLACALALTVVFLTLDVATSIRANPAGEWDAMAIWNLRARFLAGGPELWQRALLAESGGAMAGASHPGYPLLLSSFIAALWRVDGSYSDAVPVAAGVLIAAAVLLLLIASLARRSLALAVLAGLILGSTELYAAQIASQNSDLLLALSFLGAIVLLDAAAQAEPPGIATLLGAGCAIGLAAWTKNEGIPFAAAVLAVTLWRLRWRGFGFTLAGAAPALIATVVLKLMAQGSERVLPQSAGEAASKFADPSRWWQAFAGLADAFFQLGPIWAHPVLLVALLVFTLRLIPAQQIRSRLWLAIPIAAALAGDFGVYLITTADLKWHIGTSATRLAVQVWPAILFLAFCCLRVPSDAALITERWKKGSR